MALFVSWGKEPAGPFLKPFSLMGQRTMEILAPESATYFLFRGRRIVLDVAS